MEEDIHFLVDEISEKLNKDLKSILQQLKDPHAKKRVAFINKFTRALAFAASPQQKFKPLPKVSQVNLEEEYVQPVQEQVHQFPKQAMPNTQQFKQPYYSIPTTPASVPKKIVKEEPSNSGREFIQKQRPKKVPKLEQFQEVIKQPLKKIKPVEKEVSPVAETLQVDLSKEPPKPVPPSLHEEPKHIDLIKESSSKDTVVYAEIRGNVYNILEPPLNDEEKKLLTEVRKELLESPSILKDKIKLYKQIKKTAKKMKVELSEGDERQLMKLRYYLVRNLLNLAQIEPFLHDDAISKIICEGVNKPFTIVRDGKQLQTNVFFSHQDLINTLLHQLAKKTYQELSIDNPLLDATYKQFHIQGTLGTDIVPAKFIISRE